MTTKDGTTTMSNAPEAKHIPLADRIMLGIIADMADGGKLEVYMDRHNITFVRVGSEGTTGYIAALPRSAFMLAAMTLAKELESRVDDWCNDEPDSLNELANDMLLTHAETAAAYPLCVKGTDEKDGATWASEVALYGSKGMASATCLDNPQSLEDMLKYAWKPAKSEGGAA